MLTNQSSFIKLKSVKHKSSRFISEHRTFMLFSTELKMIELNVIDLCLSERKCINTDDHSVYDSIKEINLLKIVCYLHIIY